MKKLLIALTIFCSSLLFINKTSALTSDDGYNYVYFKYDYDFINEKVNTPYFNNIIADIKNEFEKSGFSCYIIYFLSNGSINAFFGNNYIGFQGYGDNSSSVDFSFVTYEQRRMLSYSLETGEKRADYLTAKVANKAVYEYIFRNINVNTYNNINDINPYFAIYDSNIRIGTDAWSDKFYLFYDLNKNELIPHQGQMPLAKDNILNNYISNSKEKLQLYSLDVYIDNKSISNFNFKITLEDYNNYAENDISKTDIDYFKFYGLKNDNGLYHWEPITDTSNYIDYDDNNYIINDNGFSFTGTTYLNFGNYEKIKLSIALKNAINYKISYYDNLKNSDFDYNYFGTEYSKFVSNYKKNKYVIFSTNKDDITNFVYIKSNNPNIFADYYNTEQKGFSSFASVDFYKTLDDINIYRFNYENIGLLNKKGFYITNNKDDNFDYYIYTNLDLYYSFNSNKDLNNSIFIDYNGDVTNSDLKTYYYQDLTDIDNIMDFVNKNNNTSTVFGFFGEVWNIFKTNNKIYIYLMLVISTSIAILVFKSMK